MFESQRLSNSNIAQYLGTSKYYPYILSYVPCLLQNDYDLANDCTLTSITTIIKHLLPSESIQFIYNKVEQIARRKGYVGWYGTPSLMIAPVLKQSLRSFQLNKKVKTLFFKDIGFTFEDIQNEINNHNLVMINLWKDGRNYYKNHTVLAIGYIVKDNHKMLAIYDNWALGISYLDYDKLSKITSINIVK